MQMYSLAILFKHFLKENTLSEFRVLGGLVTTFTWCFDYKTLVAIV